MKIKNILKLGKAAVKKPFHGEELIECANIILERREKGSFVSIPVWKDKENTENVVLIPFLLENKKGLPVSYTHLDVYKRQAQGYKVIDTSQVPTIENAAYIDLTKVDGEVEGFGKDEKLLRCV